MGYYCLPSLRIGSWGFIYRQNHLCEGCHLPSFSVSKENKTKPSLCVSVENYLKGPYVMT